MITLLCIISCDNQNKSNRSQDRGTTTNIPFRTDEQVRADQAKYDKEHEQVKKKIETKIDKLSYKSISSPRIRFYQDVAETHTPVKKVNMSFKYDAESNTLTSTEEVEDKVFTLRIMFKKYSEYEITSVQLIDEANMKYWDLE